MAITRDDFNKIWASTSPLTPYSFSNSQYKEGWNFIGSTPPSRQMWDFLQKTNDEKMQYLLTHFDNYLPLSGGTINGDLSFTGVNRKINFSNGKSQVVSFGNGVYVYGDTADKQSSFVAFTNENGSGFQINAGDGTTQRRMVGKPDGTLTWDGQPLLPTGVVQAFAGSTTPQGWLLCDGSAVSRTDYAALYAVIGTTYGAGNGSTTFNLPNLVDKFVEGSATAGTVKSAGLPNITGDFWSISTSNQYNSGAVHSNSATATFTINNGNSHANTRKDFNASWSNSIYGNSSTVQPPALTMRYIIKY